MSLSKAGLDSVAGTLQPSAIYNRLFNGESEAFSAHVCSDCAGVGYAAFAQWA